MSVVVCWCELSSAGQTKQSRETQTENSPYIGKIQISNPSVDSLCSMHKHSSYVIQYIPNYKHRYRPNCPRRSFSLHFSWFNVYIRSRIERAAVCDVTRLPLAANPVIAAAARFRGGDGGGVSMRALGHNDGSGVWKNSTQWRHYHTARALETVALYSFPDISLRITMTEITGRNYEMFSLYNYIFNRFWIGNYYHSISTVNVF